MILFTVGTEKFPFNRLMTWLKMLINEGFIQEEIVVQYGSCTNCPPKVRAYSFLPESQFQELVQQSRLVISHCGEGTILLLDAVHKPYILVPRCRSLREHIDDHQMELAVALEQEKVPIAWSLEDVLIYLKSPKWVPPTKVSSVDLCEHFRERFS